MKKIYILSFLLFLVVGLFSQDTILKSKRGIPILPQKGDWALGVDARPFTNVFNQNSFMQFDYINGITLMGKKFKNVNTAHRIKLRLGFDALIEDGFVVEDGQIVPDPFVTVKDTRTENTTNVLLGYGLEKRMGYGRLQALYGAELAYAFTSHSESYVYGNDFSMTNPSPSTTNFGTNIPWPGERVIFMEDGIRHFIRFKHFPGLRISEVFISQTCKIHHFIQCFSKTESIKTTTDFIWKITNLV